MFDCTTVSDVSYVSSDFTAKCGADDPEWQANIIPAVIILIAYPVGLHVLLLVVIWRWHRNPNTSWNAESPPDPLRTVAIGFLYEGTEHEELSGVEGVHFGELACAQRSEARVLSLNSQCPSTRHESYG
jgi:hypothetical protein